MVVCTKCKRELPEEKFRKENRKKNGLRSNCKNCDYQQKRKWIEEHQEQEKISRRKRTLRQYDITFEEYKEMFSKQEGKCAICGVLMVEGVEGNPLVACVDHNHKTGQVRGLLCSLHNRALGLFDDNIEIMKSAINYLERKT